MKKILISALFSLLLLTGCKQTPLFEREDKGPDPKLTQVELYQMGDKALAKGDYLNAIRYFEALDNRYPFGEYSEQALVDLVYTYHASGDDASSAATAGRFMHLYPRSSKIDYVFYMKGVGEFEQEHGPLLRMVPIDSALRDQSVSREAYQDLYQFVQQFPHSPYAPDAKQRLLYLRNNFAKKEIYAARYYVKKQAWVAANNRASFLVEHYGQAPEAAEALQIMVQANRKLGLTQEVNNACQVLKLNYPKQAHESAC